MRFALIDADKNRGLAKRFKISKLPTLKYFEAGYNKADDAVLLYSGKREEKNFVAFAEDLHKKFLEDPSKYAYTADHSPHLLEARFG